MFSYYGSKLKLSKHYPRPRYNLVIEPFAGAAWYSLWNGCRNVVINEKNETIYKIWKWLIEEASQSEILSQINFYKGQDISVLDLRKEHKDLIGFCINRGSAGPRNIVQKWSCQVKSRPDWASTVYFSLRRVSELLPLVKTWQVLLGDYDELPDVEATWFIDPPYQVGGQFYVENQIDYQELRNWIMTRKGQVIVCENSSNTWIETKPLVKLTGQRKKTIESIWTNQSEL